MSAQDVPHNSTPDGIGSLRKPNERHTIESLRLDIESARAGKLWKILPIGFRDQRDGRVYPLPSGKEELATLASIYVAPHGKDCGAVYLRRAAKAYKTRQRNKQSAALHIERQEVNAKTKLDFLQRTVREARAEMNEAVAQVREQAEKAVASMNDLFELGRQGLDGQMRAHLSNQEWQGEKINARAFRECYRMVSQTVGKLGLPSEQRTASRQAIVEEVAASLEATRDGLALSPSSDDSENVQ